MFPEWHVLREPEVEIHPRLRSLEPTRCGDAVMAEAVESRSCRALLATHSSAMAEAPAALRDVIHPARDLDERGVLGVQHREQVVQGGARQIIPAAEPCQYGALRVDWEGVVRPTDEGPSCRVEEHVHEEDDWGKPRHGLMYLKGTLYMKRYMSADSLCIIKW